MNKILLASGLCIMLISTGCTTNPTTRYRASLNDGRLQSPVTRSFDGYRNHNNFARNRFGSPIGRGYNVRNFSRIGNNGSNINDYARVPSLNSRNTNVTRNTNTNTNEFDSVNESRENRRSHNVNVGTEKTETKTTNKSLKMAPGKASEKHEKKEGAHITRRAHTAQENHQVKRAHTPSTPRPSSNRVLTRGVNVPGYIPNVDNRETALDRTNNLGRNFNFGRYNNYTRNNGLVRNHRRSNGYVRNYNNGNGLIRDYRFNDGLRHDGFAENHYYNNWDNGLYGGLNEGWNNGFNNDLVRYDRNNGFVRSHGLRRTRGTAPHNFSNGATFVGPHYAGLGMIAGS